MSINVHVSGNPISINRGKMVTADLDHCKKEFEKRRLMRLEQVRQQSKNIAEGVRNKVKKEKKMQIKEIEQEGKQKLKNWQNRKLLELQTQYQEAIKELGVAHKAAQAVGDENELLAEQEHLNEDKATRRGRTAEKKLYSDKFKKELEKARLEDRKKLVREIENARAQLINSAPSPKKPRVRKKQKDGSEISVTLTDSDVDDDSESDSGDLLNIEETGEIEESSSCSCAAGSSEISFIADLAKKNRYSAGKGSKERPPPSVPPLKLVSDELQTDHPPAGPSHRPPTKRFILPPLPSPRQSLPMYDTRISDRIKYRGDDVGGDLRDVKSPEPTTLPFIESRTDIRDFIDTRKCRADCVCCCGRRRLKDKESNLKENQGTQTSDNNLTQKSDSIPSHPSIKLKSISLEDQLSKSTRKESKKSASPTKRPKKTLSPQKKSKLDTKEGSKIHVYDHPNRFSHEKTIPSDSFVEKIPIESLEVMTDRSIEERRQKEARRREKDAEIRGRKALEKERLQKEYEEMLKKLPLLQKKERIGEIYNDKPEYHMSEERLQEKERARQNNLENVYNKLFPNLQPAIVTLPKMDQVREEDSSAESSVHSINVAEWDVDYKAPYKFSSQEVQDIISHFIKQKPRDRRAKLKELLKNLHIQREELLTAISALPQTDSLDELINDLKSFSVKSKPRKRTRKENEADTSVDSSQEISPKEDPVKEIPRHGSGKSPRKKAKTRSRPNVIILQNTSTQTTPKQSKDVGKKSGTPVSDKICTKLHVPCDCNKENQEITDDMCHIFIKIHEDDTPEVLVKAKDKERSNKSSLTKHTTVGTQITQEKIKRVPKKTKTKPPKPPTVKTGDTHEKSRTWRDQFSKNSISTTSTSYFSPPDFQKSDKSSFYNLRSKPQQEELSSAFSSTKYQSTQSIDLPPDPLKPFVKKLLSMSRVTIDNLSVSTSNIETPSQSIIEMESNVPKQDLRNLVQTFKDRIGSIADGLRYSPDVSPVPFNTSASSSKDAPSKAILADKPSSSSFESKEELVAQYAKISDSVTKRIQALAKMIENLREEKIQMLQVSKSKSFQDKDYSTSYMDLPKSGSTSKSSSLEEEEILRKLMEIDRSVLDRMGKAQDSSKDKTEGGSKHLESGEILPPGNSTNQEIMERLDRLKRQEISPASTEQLSFVPFLSDIPKLPKFEPIDDTGQLHKKPPTSKGLPAAKKFNGNISLIPHELSTIPEADSQLSAKLPSPESSDVNIPLLTIPEIEFESGSGKSKKTPKESSKSSSSGNKDQSTSNKDDNSKSSGEIFLSLLTSSSSSGSKSKKKYVDSTCGAINPQHHSSSSSDDIETIEAMLRSIGMEWAIPTLYKTQEALALGSSSSSSLDASKKKSHTGESSGSDVNLREYLRKHVLGKVSSSTMLSDITPPGSFAGDYSELSGIQPAANNSGDKSKQRTSTPINVTKSTSKSKVFTDSDLSSIKPDTSKSKRKS